MSKAGCYLQLLIGSGGSVVDYSTGDVTIVL